MVQTSINPAVINSYSYPFPQLQIFDAVPEGLLELESHQLADFLLQPTLIHLRGLQDPPLFVSVLLHGNETTGWLAMRELLQKYQETQYSDLPRSFSLFIGNISAARWGLRHLPHQPDYNRIWAGHSTLEEQMAQQVIQEMRERGVFASIDIHNNTGRNPHYGCITRLDAPSLFLARAFSPLAVYYTTPQTIQACAFAELCPAIILEAGQPGLPDGTNHARSFVEQFLHLAEIPDQPVTDLNLFQTVAVLKIPDGVSFCFGDSSDHDSVDLRFPAAMDRLNFCELAPGTVLAHVEHESGHLLAWDEASSDQTDSFLVRVGNQIQLRKQLLPAMISLDCEIVRSDCLCYLMERHHV